MVSIDLDIDMLRCFVAVARTESFTKAGKHIGLTQSGVSVKVRRLEERIGARVFNRTSKSLSLTPEGKMLLDDAIRILSAHDEAVSRFTKPNASGNLRIGLIDYFLPDLLPNILSKFREQYPNIHLEVRTDVGMNLIPLYEKGELDLVVTGKEAYQGTCRILAQEPLIWVVGNHTDVSFHERLDLVLLPPPCSFRKIATERLDKTGRKWEILFTGTSIANIQAAVQAGMGVSILPRGAVRKGLQKAPSRLKLPALPMYAIVLIADEQKANSARDVFINYLEAEITHLS